MKKTVVVGGCFDVLHIGHITFLEQAKLQGDYLIVLLESDASIKRLKGHNRPIHDQTRRAKILSSLKVVDRVVLLPDDPTDAFYDQLLHDLNPDVIATTKGDKGIHHKKRQAQLVNAKLIEIDYLPDQSTTKIEELLLQEL